MEINLGKHYQEIGEQLREVELRAAELRGQLQLIARLLEEAQRPALSGDPLGDSAIRTNGIEQGATTT